MRIAGLTVAGAAAVAGIGVSQARRRRAWDLRGRVVLVTGASRGLGLLIARELAARGCRLVVCARDSAELERATDMFRQGGAEVTALVCDIGEQEQAENLVRRARAAYGGIDAVVNNAGIIEVGPFETMGVEEYRRALDVMFWGPLYVTLAALPELRERKGRVVNITSIGGRISVPHLLPYCCAKFAAVALSEGLFAGLMGQGVRVTTVVPGLMRTGSHWHVRFKGAPERQYTWFATGASLPPVSMDAERAARRIVRALREGRSHLTLTPLAHVATRAYGLAPELVTRLIGGIDRLLPRGAGARDMTGHTAERHTPVVRWLTTLNAEAARRFNQVPEPRE